VEQWFTMTSRSGESFSSERDPHLLNIQNPSPGREFDVSRDLFHRNLALASHSLERAYVSHKTKICRLSEMRESTPGTSFCNFRLGECDSRGRNLQSSTPCSNAKDQQNHTKHNISRTKQPYNHREPKWTCYNHIWTTILELIHDPSFWTKTLTHFIPKT